MLEIKARICDKENKNGIVDVGVRLSSVDYQRCAELLFDVIEKKSDNLSNGEKTSTSDIKQPDNIEKTLLVQTIIDKKDILTSAAKAALNDMGRTNIEEMAVSLFKIYNEKIIQSIEEKIPANVLLDCSTLKE